MEAGSEVAQLCRLSLYVVSLLPSKAARDGISSESDFQSRGLGSKDIHPTIARLTALLLNKGILGPSRRPGIFSKFFNHLPLKGDGEGSKVLAYIDIVPSVPSTFSLGRPGE